MQVVLRFLGQRPRAGRWDGTPDSPGVERGPGLHDSQDSYERVVATEAPGGPEIDGPFRVLAAAILRFDIFPASTVRGLLRRQPLEVGDIVGLDFRPFPGIGFYFGARVIERFDERRGDWWHTGFRYRTLKGHPELGEETFSVEKEWATGAVRVALRSWSRPGLWLTRLGYPLTRLAQRRASYAALDHMQAAVALPFGQLQGPPDCVTKGLRS
jgi:hypothetical protein